MYQIRERIATREGHFGEEMWLAQDVQWFTSNSAGGSTGTAQMSVGVSTTEPSICGSDAALCHITLTTCYCYCYQLTGCG